jgi:hypothetical protein
MTKTLRSRAPLIVACCYSAIILLLFIFAFADRDDFGYSFIPVAYATAPLSLWLSNATSQFLVAIGVGGAANATILYALLKVADSVRKSREPKP